MTFNNETFAAANTPAVDVMTLNEVSGDDPDMRRDIVEMYLDQTAKQLDDIEQAINGNDATTLYNAAHKALGSSTTCGMTAAGCC